MVDYQDKEAPMIFSKELCELVDPDLILFSNSRNRHNNPIPDVISGVRASNCGAQFSLYTDIKNLLLNDDSLSNEHLIAVYPKQGTKVNVTAAREAFSILLNGNNTDVLTPLDAHRAYIMGFDDRKCI